MKKRRGKKSGERYILLPHWMLRSPAWRAASPSAKTVLLDLWQRHNGSNNGQIVYAVRDGEEVGVSKDQAARALKELIDLGFIKMRRDSSFTLKTKEARVWEITAEPADGRPASKEFMSWQPDRKSFHGRTSATVRSHQRDSGPQKQLKNGLTVAPARLSEAKSTPSRSHQRDTSILPSWDGADGDGVLSREEWLHQRVLPRVRRQLSSAQARSVIEGWKRGDPGSMDLVDDFERELRQRENRPRYPRFGDAAKAERTARRWIQ